uniref:Uncharacterized protein n=1 Tax=Setaria italica TaxID=4555 RepID=K3YFN9_SETIT
MHIIYLPVVHLSPISSVQRKQLLWWTGGCWKEQQHAARHLPV